MSGATGSAEWPDFVQKKGKYDRSLKAKVVSIFDAPAEFGKELSEFIIKGDQLDDVT